MAVLTERRRPADLIPLALGLAALALGTAFGWDSRVIDAVVRPPAIVRAILIGGAATAGIWLLAAALQRLAASPDVAAGNLRSMVRGIRLVFLAIAAFAAAAGWVVAHPLPIVVAFVIAGVDVIETSFLLLVVSRRQG